MITAKYNNQYLELSESLTIEKVTKSQLLSFDKLKGEHVPSFEIPNTANNRNILKHPDRFELERTGKLEFENIEVRFDGWLIIEGTFVIEEATEKEFSGYIRGAIGNLGAKNKEKNITDFTLPESVTYVSKNYYDSSIDDYCCFGLKNEYFFKDIGKMPTKDTEGNEQEYNLLQILHKNLGFEVNRFSNGDVLINNNPLVYFSPDNYQLTVVSPFLYLFKVIEKLLNSNDFYLSRNDIENDNELMNVALYHNRDITKCTHDTTIVSGGKEKDGELVLITWQKEVYRIHRNVSTFDYKDCLPKMTLKDILLSTQNSFNIAFILNEDNSYSIIDREQILLGSSLDLSEYLTSKWILGTKKNICIKHSQKHDNEDKIFSDFYIDLSDRIEDFGEPVETEEALQAIEGSFLGELRIVETYMIWEWVFDVVVDVMGNEKEVFAWKYISNTFQPHFFNYKEGREIEEIKTNFSTLSMQAGFPTVMQKGQTELRKSESGDITPRLMFYQGAGHASNESETYYSFNYSNDLGLPKSRWKYFNKFWAFRQPVEAKFNLPVNILFYFDINRKYRTIHGEFLIEEMTTPISHTRVGKTTVKGYKVDFEDENEE